MEQLFNFFLPVLLIVFLLVDGVEVDLSPLARRLCHIFQTMNAIEGVHVATFFLLKLCRKSLLHSLTVEFF